jgi:antitoxin FitA
MSQIIIPDLDEDTLARLQERASAHGHTLEAEVKRILAEASQPATADAWTKVNALREALIASGRCFGDSAELVREDRDR